MPARKRTTVHLDQRLHRALRLRARATDCTVSEVVAEGLRQLFTQEARSIERAKRASGHPDAMSLSDVGARLKRRKKA
jgi:hypothetical protein